MRFSKARSNLLIMAFNLTYLKDIRNGVPASDFAAKGCLNPRKIWVYDNVLGKNVEMYVNCGHCIRCFDQKREEFTTRMFLHAIKYEFVYFITLTYGTYNLNLFDSHPFKQDWLDTHPVCDTFNSSHRPRWTPTLVIQSHVQKFFKRLRKMGFSFSYVAAGELGETWSRPHHHLVIYSHSPISKHDFERAWSYHCVRTANPKVIETYNGRQDVNRCFWFRIGRVDYNDLYANGSMDWSSPAVANSSSNALRCFNYVAKYICKVNFKDSDSSISKFALNRLRRVYDSLPTSVDYNKVIPYRSKFIKIMKQGAFGPNDFIPTDCIDVYDDYADDLFVEYLRCRASVVCSDFSSSSVVNPDFSLDIHDINNPFNPKFYETKKVLFNGRWLDSCDFDTFLACFSQYFTFSRSTPIGLLYFEEKCADFEKGNFALPEAFGKSLEFPSYYYSLLSRKRHPFCFRKNTFSGTSFVKGNLSLVYEFYSKFIEDKSSLLDINFTSLSSVFNKQEVESSNVSGLIDPYFSSHGSLLGVSFVTHNMRIHYNYDFSADEFVGYVYDRHLKDFVFYDSLSRVDMCIFILRNIEEIFNEHSSLSRKRSNKNILIDLISHDDNSFAKKSSYCALRKSMSKNYSIKHLTRDLQ